MRYALCVFFHRSAIVLSSSKLICITHSRFHTMRYWRMDMCLALRVVTLFSGSCLSRCIGRNRVSFEHQAPLTVPSGTSEPPAMSRREESCLVRMEVPESCRNPTRGRAEVRLSVTGRIQTKFGQRPYPLITVWSRDGS